MANIKSAEKRNRQNEKIRLRNRRYMGISRSAIKNARKVLTQSDAAGALEVVKEACTKLDQAVSKGIIHRNNAARRKSRLMAALNRTSAQTAN